MENLAGVSYSSSLNLKINTHSHKEAGALQKEPQVSVEQLHFLSVPHSSLE